MSGLGVDRHLQGLKLVAQEAGLDLPNIYSDPGFLKSGRMRISSSQVSIIQLWRELTVLELQSYRKNSQ